MKPHAALCFLTPLSLLMLLAAVPGCRRQDSGLLDPASFTSNPTAYVAYSIAQKTPNVLSDVPCACPCKLWYKHKNLLDCFRSNHGAECSACKKEAIFCFEAHKRGQNTQAIREAIDQMQWTSINLEAYSKSFLQETQTNRH